MVFKLPEKIKESSGVEVTEMSNLIWTMEDSGNKPELYALGENGKIVNTITVLDEKNIDWEDLTSDKEGNLYIGDFGNNKNERQNLAIYKIAATDLTKQNVNIADRISFFYPEQQDFPPKKTERHFDAESFFIFNNNFYLFTKDRSSDFEGLIIMYRVPNKKGYHAAEMIGNFKTGGEFKDAAITSADLSPDGTKVVLLSGSKIWLFTNFIGDDFLNGIVKEIPFDNSSQKEGICFKTNDALYITDEINNNGGGKLYEFDLSK